MMNDQIKIGELEKYLRTRGRLVSTDAEELDDAIQELWLAVLNRPLAMSANVPWLFGVLRNLLRRRYRQRSMENTELSPLPIEEEAPSTAEDVLKSELSREVQQAVLELPEQYREVVVLKYFCHLPSRAIAEELGCSVKTVQNRIYRANQAMREKLAHHRDNLTCLPFVFAIPSVNPIKKLASRVSLMCGALLKPKFLMIIPMILIIIATGLVLQERTGGELGLEADREFAAHDMDRPVLTRRTPAPSERNQQDPSRRATPIRHLVARLRKKDPRGSQSAD